MNDLLPLVEDQLAVIDDVLLYCPGGRMRALPAAELLKIGLSRLKVWANRRARYTLVTAELVEWLREQIGGRRALEIGAGMGDLGYHLGIPQTDLGLQTALFRGSLLELIGQAPTVPPDDVKRLEAEQAILYYQPEVVIGSWVTERQPEIPGYGVREERMFESGRTYILVGNDRPHKNKSILELPHELHRFSWLVSRAIDPAQNYIRVWRGKP